jgi:hypothetical protein
VEQHRERKKLEGRVSKQTGRGAKDSQETALKSSIDAMRRVLSTDLEGMKVCEVKKNQFYWTERAG